MPKKRTRHRRLSGRQADCSFKCPAKGYIDFPVWIRKGESINDACNRKLTRLVDKDQIPLCEKIRVRSLGNLPLPKRLPKVKIVRE